MPVRVALSTARNQLLLHQGLRYAFTMSSVNHIVLSLNQNAILEALLPLPAGLLMRSRQPYGSLRFGATSEAVGGRSVLTGDDIPRSSGQPRRLYNLLGNSGSAIWIARAYQHCHTYCQHKRPTPHLVLPATGTDAVGKGWWRAPWICNLGALFGQFDGLLGARYAESEVLFFIPSMLRMPWNPEFDGHNRITT